MKILSLFLLFLVSLPVYALEKLDALEKLERIRVDKIVCGEIDPYILGDACLVYGSSKKKAFGLVFDIDQFSNSKFYSLEPGDFFEANFKNANKIKDPAVNAVINRYGKNLNTSLKTFWVSKAKTFFVSTAVGKVEKEFSLSCQATEQFDGSMMWSTVSVESKLLVRSFESYELVRPLLKYELSMSEDFTTLWDSFQARDPDYSLFNRRHYRPSKYRGHVKFNNLYSSKTFGEVDLILPIKALSAPSKFQGFAIMTHISDHWGGTVKLDCQLR
ncbi:MAG: hypothetical protein WD025_08510 [Bacteriovoracaceae bacterium]